MKLLFKHKKHGVIVDKDIFDRMGTISFNIKSNNSLNGMTETDRSIWTLNDILFSDEWDVIVPDYLTHEELHKLAHILYNDITLNGDQYWLSNTLRKIEELALLYDIEGENILS